MLANFLMNDNEQQLQAAGLNNSPQTVARNKSMRRTCTGAGLKAAKNYTQEDK
jgi:hypothetical protein